MKQDKKRKNEAVLMLRCIGTYADFAVERIDEANPIGDSLLDSLRDCKEFMGNIVGCMFERIQEGN